ncbi:MAG: hypothetical protein V1735_07970 [Nanoarchaeota archaeon]
MALQDGQSSEGKGYVGRFSVPRGTLVALMRRTDSAEAQKAGYTHTLPFSADLCTIGELELRMTALGIPFGNRDVFPAFKSEEEMNAALLAVFQSGYAPWALEDYLVRQGLIEKPKPAPQE